MLRKKLIKFCSFRPKIHGPSDIITLLFLKVNQLEWPKFKSSRIIITVRPITIGIMTAINVILIIWLFGFTITSSLKTLYFFKYARVIKAGDIIVIASHRRDLSALMLPFTAIASSCIDQPTMKSILILMRPLTRPCNTVLRALREASACYAMLFTYWNG